MKFIKNTSSRGSLATGRIHQMFVTKMGGRDILKRIYAYLNFNLFIILGRFENKKIKFDITFIKLKMMLFNYYFLRQRERRKRETDRTSYIKI